MRNGGIYIRIVETAIFKKAEKKNLNEDNCIQHKKYNMKKYSTKNTTHLYTAKNTTQKIQYQKTEELE